MLMTFATIHTYVMFRNIDVWSGGKIKIIFSLLCDRLLDLLELAASSTRMHAYHVAFCDSHHKTDCSRTSNPA